MAQRMSNITPNLKTWVSKQQWEERIITFDNSWFTLTMGTGVIVQLLNFFPYPANWLKNLGYIFWILEIVLFAFFTAMALARLILHPKVALSVLSDVNQTSYLGAIPISIDTLGVGIVLYYHEHSSGIYVAEVFYWISVTVTTLVGCGGVFAIYNRQGHHQLSEVTGVWLLCFIPMIVTSAFGSTLGQYLRGGNESTILIVSFLMLSLGVGVSSIIVVIYFWRLLHCSLPERDAIVSCFIPVGPFGMGAFAIFGLSLDLARYVSNQRFNFAESYNPAVDNSSQAAVAQMIEWIGAVAAIALLGIATFFLIEAFASVFSKVPKSFNIGFWGFVFPCGVYSNAWCRLSTNLRNEAMKGWAATCVVATVLLWLMCAITTLYKGVWQGKLFVAPGLQGYVERESLDRLKNPLNRHDQDKSEPNSTGGKSGQECLRHRAVLAGDGTYKRMWPEPDEHV